MLSDAVPVKNIQRLVANDMLLESFHLVLKFTLTDLLLGAYKSNKLQQNLRT